MRREDMTSAAKFRAVCDRCGQKSPVRTAYTVGRWMDGHEQGHRTVESLTAEGLGA